LYYFQALIGRGEENLQVMFQNVKERIHVKEAAEQAERLARQVIEAGKRGWRVVAHWELPEWLRDNDFIDHGHRPPLESFRLCFKSMFRIHTETGNIWTHLLGFIAFVCVTLYFYLRPVTLSNPFPRDITEKFVFGSFFAGALFCLAFSTLYHTMDCHSDKISNLFSR
jgi:adiponectin receptor